MIDSRDFLAGEEARRQPSALACWAEGRPERCARFQRSPPSLGQARIGSVPSIPIGAAARRLTEGAELITAKWPTAARCSRSRSRLPTCALVVASNHLRSGRRRRRSVNRSLWATCPGGLSIMYRVTDLALARSACVLRVCSIVLRETGPYCRTLPVTRGSLGF
jgi:hypothetical protein